MTDAVAYSVGVQDPPAQGPSLMKVARGRLALMTVVFSLVMAVLIGRVLMLGLVSLVEDNEQVSAQQAGKPVLAVQKAEVLVPALTASRANITDRNGVLLATTLETAALSVDPRGVSDKAGLARALAVILDGKSEATLLAALEGGGSFRWLARKLTPRQVVAVNALGEPALEFHRAEERIYPHGRLASHVLGRVNSDGKGSMGIESHFEDRLRDPGRLAEPLALSIDVRAQYALGEELSASMRAHRAVGAAGLIMDARTGEILALASLPDFDPNVPLDPMHTANFNRAAMGAYELGSIFKTFTLAAALDDGTVSLTDEFDATKPLRVRDRIIHDDHPQNRVLNVPEIYVHSSNIGTAQIAHLMGAERQKAFLGTLGFLRRPTLELPETTAAFGPRQWADVETATISFGHGVTASPVQLVQAMAAMVNGGRLMEATLWKKPRDTAFGRQVIREETSRTIRQLMRLAVTTGTGGKANAVGYRVGGKTGTAEMAVAGGYDASRLRSSFVGAFPMDDPRYVVFAMLEEPQGTEATLGLRSAGWTAAPVVGNVISRVAPILGVRPKKEEEELYQTTALMIRNDN